MDIIEFDFNNIDPLKDYIYVLQLIDDRYYIGRSQNVLQRIEQHFNGDGSVYTKKFKPLKVVEIVEETTNEDERNKTIEYIKKYTWEKVRGYVWCRIDYKNPVKIDNMVLERKVLYDEVDEKVKQLYCVDNKDIIEIGKELDITPGSVAHKLKHMNIVNSKKMTRGYFTYIRSDVYKEMCKTYIRKGTIQKTRKPNISSDKINYKEKINKLKHDIQEVDVNAVKNTIRDLFMKP
jgi:predicted GIY-YIG superfamily endonuclease